MAVIETRCCIAGGGPAGIMLGLMLARAGVDVLVLEKHSDFLRDFRGDTLHPSTLEVIYELGLLEDLLKLPHQETRVLKAQIGNKEISIADFSHLPTHCRFIAFMPQWDFLNFAAAHANRYPTFDLRMRAEVTDLIRDSERIIGVEATTAEGRLEVRADLVVGADGRNSIVREKADLRIDELGVPIDVLWFRLPRQPGDPEESMGRFDRGQIGIFIDRGAYWQCGVVIAKGMFDQIRQRGLAEFRDNFAKLAPFIGDRVMELSDWSKVKLLTVRVDRLPQWSCPGLLCIGDAAHAMSPVGGVGINLAIQDAVAAANVLALPLRDRRLTGEHLSRVQRRRSLPTRITQRIQILIQNRIIKSVLASEGNLEPPFAVRLLTWFPLLRRIPARMIGIGLRPEHVRTPLASC